MAVSELVKKIVASEGRSRSAGAQEPECILKYMRIPSTAGTRDPQRSRFFHKLSALVAIRFPITTRAENKRQLRKSEPSLAPLSIEPTAAPKTAVRNG